MTATIEDADVAPLPPAERVGGKRRPLHEPFECDECEGPLVMVKGDKRCNDCGLLSGSVVDDEPQTEWEEWHEHRRESDDYEGFTGQDRIKFVGGFISCYFNDDGDLE